METQPTVQSSHRILLEWYSIKDQISEKQQVSRGRSQKLTEILSTAFLNLGVAKVFSGGLHNYF